MLESNGISIPKFPGIQSSIYFLIPLESVDILAILLVQNFPRIQKPCSFWSISDRKDTHMLRKFALLRPELEGGAHLSRLACVAIKSLFLIRYLALI